MLRVIYVALMALWVAFVLPGLTVASLWRAFWRAWARLAMTVALVKFLRHSWPAAWDEACRRFD